MVVFPHNTCRHVAGLGSVWTAAHGATPYLMCGDQIERHTYGIQRVAQNGTWGSVPNRPLVPKSQAGRERGARDIRSRPPGQTWVVLGPTRMASSARPTPESRHRFLWSQRCLDTGWGHANGLEVRSSAHM
jgi:hypothetical protein